MNEYRFKCPSNFNDYAESLLCEHDCHGKGMCLTKGICECYLGY